MTDLWVEFVAARLDEEEAAAKGPPGWRLEHWSATRYKISASGREWRVDAEPRCVLDAVAKEDAEHIVRYDPARALRQVAATRALLAAYEASVRSLGPGLSVSLLRLVQAAAEVWRDHPAYAALAAAA